MSNGVIFQYSETSPSEIVIKKSVYPLNARKY